eukprot:TRINITY_DN1078_c0_g1_i2.p1 TRINITY_DN1078_c0_g1~~TRINITY_DN1078_c0_g1_i2.p1  ORF type:complete len:468 (+),score=215.27 TRINITY_DN1078_c0_g1_i2:166-1569(+)
MNKVYDLAIIGTGPGGYISGIKAAQLGMKVAIIERDPVLGGCCYRTGCVPSKTLLHISRQYEDTKKNLKQFGITVNGPITYDWKVAQEHRKKQILDVSGAIESSFKKYGVELIRGNASINDQKSLKVILNDTKKEQIIKADNILLATGSQPFPLGNIKIDEEVICSSNAALAFEEVPKSLVIIGAGAVGLELGSVYKRMGSKVTILEAQNRITTFADLEMSDALEKIMLDQELKIVKNAKVSTAIRNSNGVLVTYTQDGKTKEIQADKLLVSVGRRPTFKGLGLEKVGITLTKQGDIDINSNYQTAVPSIFAVGDIIKGEKLGVTAGEEGCAVIDYIRNGKCQVKYHAIPKIIFTFPELAFVGKNEEELKKLNIPYKIGKYPFSHNSRASCTYAPEGLIKVIADQQNKIIGMHIVGSDAGEMIHEGAIAVNLGLTTEQLASQPHGHPSLSGAIREAAMSVHANPIHM